MSRTASHKPLIINVVSGKGGTGKSLLVAVLGQALARRKLRVLIVDFDIFVRGLTILSARKQKLREGGLTVSDYLHITKKASSARKGPPAIEPFMECDLIPAVSNASDIFEYDESSFSSPELSRNVLRGFLASIPDEYDLVFLDNRAGIDNLIIASCAAADLIVSVVEDDRVALETNANLINHLRYDRRLSNVYTIINKARRVEHYEDLQKRMFSTTEYHYAGIVLGLVPFDMDVMENYGSERLWNTVYRTLYFRAIIDVWNMLALQIELPELNEKDYVFPPQILMKSSTGRFTTLQRALLLYGILFSALGFFFYLYQQVLKGSMSMPELTAIGFGFFGLLLVVLVTMQGSRAAKDLFSRPNPKE